MCVHDWQRKIEHRPFVRRASNPDPPGVAIDNALAQSEAHPRSRILGGCMKSLKNDKHAICVALVKADAVVVHGELPRHRVLFTLSSDVNLGGSHAPKFYGITDQILKNKR